ncbi:ABC transporter permease [Brooklawnia cerclae]|uniref:NitT/TauT family transport system permease protein n=1 Tax=Brooklawnia cerclae TaxID=349934 RepID=A0ABX0SFG5_9ACTN|nr:ABC transporter permease [Brooklawnia cerclae]NIH56740.1 NitT/TauT family transport system permease protein [Brooklawnia cerclae]
MGLHHRRAPWSVRVAAPVLLALVVLVAWWILARSGGIPRTLLPAPGSVVERLAGDLSQGRMVTPTLVTLWEAALGCLLAAAVALPIAYLIAHNHVAEAALSPYLAASQAIPAVALAPLLVLWVGYGTLPVVLLCSVMVFFPVVLSTVLGLRSIDRDVIDAARVDGAGRTQLARWLEWPLALPATLTGLRNGFTLSITGAVVGELVMGGSGLGQRLAVQSQSNDTVGLFATLVVLSVLAIVIYLTMSGVEWLADPLASRPHWRALFRIEKEKQL